jgi:hypothetical protein
MLAPKTTTLFWLAALFWLATAMVTPNYYPAPVPVISADGIPLLGPDGKPVLHHDMAIVHRFFWRNYLTIPCAFFLSGWWLTRVLRMVFGRGACRKMGG